MARFAKVLADIDVLGCEREPADAALIVPSYLEGAFPFTEAEDRSYLFTMLRQAYIAAKEADLPVGLTRERDGIAEDCGSRTVAQAPNRPAASTQEASTLLLSPTQATLAPLILPRCSS